MQGRYAATKHAVKGFTDALRVEQQQVDGAAISITLIQPTAVATPYDEHARNYQPQDAKLPTPMVKPEQVADAILGAAVKPERHVKVGLMSKVNTFLANDLPGVADPMSGKQADHQHRDGPARDPAGALEEAGESGRVQGRHA